MKQQIKQAIVTTIPVMVGYLFVGFAFGLLLSSKGYSFWWALGMGVVIYSGSMQFVAIQFLSAPFGWASMILISLAVNVRHMVYGLSFIQTFFAMGKKRPYMIYSLTDETYSLLSQSKVKQSNVQQFFWIALCNQIYWLIGSVAGGLVGGLIPFGLQGIDFAMTALFLVIFTEQWLDHKQHHNAILGIVISITSLICFKADHFIGFALMGIIVSLLLARRVQYNQEVEQ